MLTFTNPNSTQPKKAVFISGAHHARELSSISMCLYMMLETLYQAHLNDTMTWAMLNSTILYFVPVVNVDGVKHISEGFYQNGGLLKYIRKNRNDGTKDGKAACRNN